MQTGRLRAGIGCEAGAEMGAGAKSAAGVEDDTDLTAGEAQ